VCCVYELVIHSSRCASRTLSKLNQSLRWLPSLECCYPLPCVSAAASTIESSILFCLFASGVSLLHKHTHTCRIPNACNTHRGMLFLNADDSDSVASVASHSPVYILSIRIKPGWLSANARTRRHSSICAGSRLFSLHILLPLAVPRWFCAAHCSHFEFNRLRTSQLHLSFFPLLPSMCVSTLLHHKPEFLLYIRKHNLEYKLQLAH